MNARLAVVTLLVAAVAVPLAGPVAGAGFADVLDTPAQASTLASRGLMQAVARAGDRLVAVGQRGHVVVSTDGGKTWKQSMIPVSSDLTAVYFVDAKEGWAVGHDGVVLHTADGGESWQLQLDGRKANDMLVGAMERKVAAEPASESAKALLAEAKRYKEQGADKPFLDVWFADARNGYVVGAYNLIFRTADGGKTWEPWFDRTDNPKFFNLYSIRPAAGDLYIAGEGGLVLKLDADRATVQGARGSLQGQLFRCRSRGQRRARLRASRQRLAQRQRRRRVDQGRGRSAGGDRRRGLRREPARSSWPTPAAGSPRAATADVPLLRSRSSHRCRSPASPTSATGDSCWRVRAASP